jgi:hypothetical protein
VTVIAPREDARHPGYEIRSHTEETKVYFWSESNGLPDDVIEAYVKTREGVDKAGGYAIQGMGGMVLVERIDGSVDNVVGLPVRRTLSLAEKVLFKMWTSQTEAHLKRTLRVQVRVGSALPQNESNEWWAIIDWELRRRLASAYNRYIDMLVPVYSGTS